MLQKLMQGTLRVRGFFCTVAAALCVVALVGLSACGSSQPAETGSSTGATGAISVISREDGSGTRGAFIELLKIEDKEGNDATTSSAVVSNSTATVMTTVAGDKAAIGYISLGSLDDSVKAIAVDGVEPTATSVKDGSYKIARPFNVVTGSELSDNAKDFLAFILSSEGQKIVEDNGYVAAVDNQSAYTASNISGKITVAGSSSVTPVMEKLAEAYQKLNPGVSVEVQQSDSSTGVQGAIDGVCDLGMASRELKDSEKAKGVSSTSIAMDGIAVIVNKDNALSGLKADQIRSIYLGEIADWSEVA
ncbi:substrate-binding domain-containing protein [Atopobium fossor]|uniref:substrate-binding domain-containing protein n=1 Tax=Atopobium fossor TaxID=39487 RepID=UPI000401C22A|nr:substrate-binding domain-containing protein [Atopobium fossor]